MRAWIFLLLPALSLAQDLHFKLIERETVWTRFGRVTPKNPDREAALRTMFAEAGCESGLTEAKVRGSKIPNVVCKLPGKSEQTFVVSAHFDNAGQGEGAIDNWSGASLLPSVYQSLALLQERKATFIFIGFTDEEKGLVGSRDWVDHLPKAEVAKIAANINVDSVGLTGPLLVWASRADKELINRAAGVASAIKVALSGMNIDKVGNSDSWSFVQHKIPVIDFHSLTPKTLPLLHSKKDLRAEVDQNAYYETYRFLAAYLSYLDSQVQE